MSSVKSEFLHRLTSRGFLHQATDLAGLDDLLQKNKNQVGYIGFDATADSLHVGSLIAIMMLRHLQLSGGRPLVLMGGGTSLVGDPSGKDEARQILTPEAINNNIVGIKKIFSAYIDFTADRAMMLNNADWLTDLSYIDMLRDIGKHFSVNKMLQMESVRLRLSREQNLSFLEFNYMVLQSYDFMVLNKNHGCLLQMGGSDQWGNIVMGIDLTRRVNGSAVFGLTAPLLTTASGAKMGKTAAGAVWLNKEKLSPYDFWQFWRNVEDADVGRFLKLFTDLPLDDIAKLEKLQGAELNEAKKTLADEVTKLCHGADAQAQAAATAANVFQGAGSDDNLPSITIGAKTGLLDIIKQFGFADSNSEARRLVEQGGVKLNDAAVADPFASIDQEFFAGKPHIKLSVGKKRHGLIKWQK
ncbi:MAG: tyrosine--tRNA ligase [Hydrotalea sp.]|nr:tyrosine--tRNA ligase [Hydrotalea sp.]